MRRIRSWFVRAVRWPWRAIHPTLMSRPTDEDRNTPVRGDRGATLASRARSLQARLNGLLAGGLVVGILVAMLVWYYGEALRPTGSAVATAHSVNPDPGGTGPPPLGSIPARQLIEVPARLSASRTGRVPPGVARKSVATMPLARLLRSRVASGWQSQHFAVTGVRQELHNPALERRLSGSVFIRARASDAQRASATSYPAPAPGRGASSIDVSRPADATLHALLHPTVLAATRAQLLPQRRLLLARGTFIDCTLESAIDSTLPGMTTCITATDTFSADGTVVLLPRGTELIGQTRGNVRQGMARVFVIWTQARTPSGVVVQLDSPATDSLGRSGLTGTVDRHFWQRFGAALLVSTLTGFVQSRLENTGGAVIIDPTASEDVLAQTLRGAQDIAPTIEVPNGQRIEVLVARDVDFRPVYELVDR